MERAMELHEARKALKVGEKTVYEHGVLPGARPSLPEPSASQIFQPQILRPAISGHPQL
jgi:hypothetical protein